MQQTNEFPIRAECERKRIRFVVKIKIYGNFIERTNMFAPIPFSSNINKCEWDNWKWRREKKREQMELSLGVLFVYLFVQSLECKACVWK